MEIEALKNKCEEIQRDDNIIELPNEKWIERRLITFENGTKIMYAAYYNFLDQYEDKCYFGEGYVSENYYKIEKFYNSIAAI